jgi:ankyrin repeat protein
MSLVIDKLKSKSSLDSILALMESRDFTIDFQDPETGQTPLLTAIVKKREDVALALIQRGANVELCNLNGTTPLMLASFQNLQYTAQALVRAGADIDRADVWTPLICAASNGYLSLVQNLLSWGADLHAVGASENMARELAKQYCHHGTVQFLDAYESILAVRSAEEVRRLAKLSALKRFPRDLGRMLGQMLM